MESLASLMDADGMPSSMLEARLRQAMSAGPSERTGPTNDVRGPPCSAREETVAVAESRLDVRVGDSRCHRVVHLRRPAAAGYANDALGKEMLGRSLQTISSGRGLKCSNTRSPWTA